MKTLKDFNFKNKRVLVRCDFNVQLNEKGRITEDFRIKETLPTIEYLIKKGAKVILMSHLGRPEGRVVNELRLDPIAKRLSNLLNRPVKKLDDCVGKEVKKEVERIQTGEIILLENIQFNPGENKNDPSFAKTLASYADIFIMEAFGQAHRNYASIAGIQKYLPSAAGFLLEKEIKILSMVLEKPWRPLVVIIGGVKIDTKIGVISQFLKKADHLLLGGEAANAILIGKGLSLGKSLIGDKGIVKKGEEDKSSSSPTEALAEVKKRTKFSSPFAVARAIEEIDITNPKLHLPVDGFISLEKRQEDYFREGAIGTIKKEEKIFDIGPETIKIFSEIIKTAKMILWSGPLGLSEEKKFEKGTKGVAESIVKNKNAFKIIGGGDTIAAVDKFGLISRFDHVSTGGGAMLEFLSGEKLPGLEVLK